MIKMRKNYYELYIKYKRKNFFHKGGNLPEFVYFDNDNRANYDPASYEYELKIEIPHYYIQIDDKLFETDQNGEILDGVLSDVIFHLKIKTGFEDWANLKSKDIKQTDKFKDLLRIYETYSIIKKIENRVIYKTQTQYHHNQFIAYMIIDKLPVGYMYGNIGDTIIVESIDIHPDYQGKKLCRPFLAYALKNLKKYEKQITIFNYSNMRIPACLCYIRAGIDSGYKVSDVNGREITDDICINDVDNISRNQIIYIVPSIK